MAILRSVLGLVFIFLVGFLISSDRKHIQFKQIGIMVSLQLLLSFICLHTTGGIKVLAGISAFFSWLMEQAAGGVNFVFGGIQLESGSFVFFFNVLMPIVFISALVGILNYLKILPFVIKWVGKGINKITGMGELESYFSISTAVLGQPEVFITIKDKIPNLSPRQLYTICASAMSAVSAAMLASYMSMVDGKYVVVAVFLNIFSALIISCVVNPYDPEKETSIYNSDKTDEKNEISKERQPFFQVLGTYILDGFHLAVTVAAMLIGFIALVTFLNNSFDYFFNITFTKIIGYIFSPIAYAIGVPQTDITSIGSLMATKLITNEFVAMGELSRISSTLTPKGLAMISTYLVSFANFGSLGIVSGAIKSIDEKQGGYVAKYSIKLLLGATLASLLTASIVGLFF